MVDDVFDVFLDLFCEYFIKYFASMFIRDNFKFLSSYTVYSKTELNQICSCPAALNLGT